MKFKLALAFVALVPFLTICPDANAQGAYQQSQGDTGVYGRNSRSTAMMTRPETRMTTAPQTPQARGGLPQAGFGGLTRIIGPRGRNGLPDTRLDSFVRRAGGNAFMIFGDEGVTLPPIDHFTPASRIQRTNMSNGLSTGHGSTLDNVWGGTRTVDWEGQSRSGPNGGSVQNWRPNIADFGLNRVDMSGRGLNGSNTVAPTVQHPTRTPPHGSTGSFGFSFP